MFIRKFIGSKTVGPTTHAKNECTQHKECES